MSWLWTLLSGGIFAGQAIKQKSSYVPVANWRNQRLIDYDRYTLCISSERFLNNLECGKYYLPDVPPDAVIDYIEEYWDDVGKHSFQEAYDWALEGKYSEAYKEELQRKLDKKRRIRREYVQPKPGYVNVYNRGFMQYRNYIRAFKEEEIKPFIDDDRFFYVYDELKNETYLIVKNTNHIGCTYAASRKYSLDYIWGLTPEERDKFYDELNDVCCIDEDDDEEFELEEQAGILKYDE